MPIWTFTFDEQGGEDCVTPAVVVSREGETQFRIDAKDHGWNCAGLGDRIAEHRAWIRHDILALAQKIADSLNASGV